MINQELRNKNINILCGDILYKEGILEFLEKNSDVDYIVLNEDLTGNIKINELVDKIKLKNNKIRIILITKNHNNQIKVFRKIEKIDKENIEDIILNKNSVFNMKTIPINDFFEDNTKDGTVISILGPNGVGKSIFSITFSNSIKDKKILIVDFDVFNNSLNNLLGIKNKKDYGKNLMKSYQNNININDFIVKIENNMDYLLSMNLIFNSELQISSQRIRNIISKLKSKYDYIIIDTSAEGLIEYTKEIVKISDELIFISGANLLELKKSQKLLEIYTREWNVSKDKIKIIFNKYTKQSLDDEVLKQIFRSYEILGKIKLSDYYDLAINKNKTNKREIQKEINHIGRKIVKVKVRKKIRKY